MATLTDPHWECVPPILKEVFITIGRYPLARRFYLAGGTALALQLGHRTSVDLDFFSPEDELLDESRAEIISALQESFTFDVLTDTIGNLHLSIQGSIVGFMGYGYRLLAPTIELEGVALAGLLDIGLMKLDALVGRGARKDFYDLYFLSRHIPLDELLEQGQPKYSHVRDFGMMALTALANFEIADHQVPVETRSSLPWEEVKAFFTSEIRRIGHRWFEEQ
jgi:predicted nucleotidyltransferase component of viral defense system